MAPSLTSAGDNYKGKAPYLEVQRYKDKYTKNPDVRPKGAKKLGFGSADFPKRDEYSNVMSTERLRETIRKEDTLVKRKARPGAEDDMEEDYMGEDTGMRASSGAIAQQNLYDVVNRMPDVSFKYRRDDRQGRFFYMHQRLKEAEETTPDRALADLKGLRHLKWLDQRAAQRTREEGRAWVQAQLPNGTRLSVLVDRNSNQVLAQKTIDGGHGAEGGY